MSIDFAAIAEAGRQLQEEKTRLTREVSDLGAEKTRLERLVLSLEPENQRLRAEKGRIERVIASLEPENLQLREDLARRAEEVERLQRLLRDMREAVAGIGGICQQMVSKTDAAVALGANVRSAATEAVVAEPTHTVAEPTPAEAEPAHRQAESPAPELTRKRPLWKIGGVEEPDWIDRAPVEELVEELARCRRARQETTAARIEERLIQLGASIPTAA